MNSVLVMIDGIKFEIKPTYYDITISSLIKEVKDRRKDDALVEYLKNKYDGYIGVPYDFIEEETHLNKAAIDNWLRCELEQKSKLKDKFVPFELVSKMARSRLDGCSK